MILVVYIVFVFYILYCFIVLPRAHQARGRATTIADCNIPHHYLAPLFGVTPLYFRRDIWQQKTGVVCVILRLAVLVQYRRVTDGRADEQTHDISIYRAGIVSRGNQVAQLSLTNPRDALHHGKRQNFKTVKSCVIYLTKNKTKIRLPLKLSLLRGSRPKSASASFRQCAHSALDFV